MSGFGARGRLARWRTSPAHALCCSPCGQSVTGICSLLVAPSVYDDCVRRVINQCLAISTIALIAVIALWSTPGSGSAATATRSCGDHNSAAGVSVESLRAARVSCGTALHLAFDQERFKCYRRWVTATCYWRGWSCTARSLGQVTTDLVCRAARAQVSWFTVGNVGF